MMKKKIKFALFACALVLALGGFGNSDTRVMKSGIQLIDLEKAIQEATAGSDALTKPEQGDENPNRHENTGAGQENTGTGENTQTIFITISGESIKFGGSPCDSIEKLEERLRIGGKVQYKLMDDFAEAHVYKRVRKLLETLKSEIGLRYTES